MEQVEGQHLLGSTPNDAMTNISSCLERENARGQMRWIVEVQETRRAAIIQGVTGLPYRV